MCRCIADSLDMTIVKASAAGLITFFLILLCIIEDQVTKCRLRKRVDKVNQAKKDKMKTDAGKKELKAAIEL